MSDSTASQSPQPQDQGAERDAISLFARGDYWAIMAGAFSLGLAVAVRFVVGEAYSNYEARVLFKALVGGGLYLASSLAGGAATILALTLTVLGLTRNSDTRFSNALYGQMRWIAIMAAAVLASSVVALLLMSVPLTRADNIPRGWIKGFYYTVSGVLATSSGAMIALVVMLLTAVLGIIRAVAPDAD